ncbi:MAG TPA: YbdD/YjiX family protein [Actinomycetota bacterium]|nr:YbdD/YjiX family protein [Actinomycetota bacterium]
MRRDDHYLAHQRRDHPGEPVLSRREFECRRLDRLEVRPGQRCC